MIISKIFYIGQAINHLIIIIKVQLIKANIIYDFLIT